MNSTIMEVKRIDPSEIRRCNVCGEMNSGREVLSVIELGMNRNAMCVYICNSCLDKFSKKISEYIGEKDE